MLTPPILHTLLVAHILVGDVELEEGISLVAMEAKRRRLTDIVKRVRTVFYQ